MNKRKFQVEKRGNQWVVVNENGVVVEAGFYDRSAAKYSADDLNAEWVSDMTFDPNDARDYS